MDDHSEHPGKFDKISAGVVAPGDDAPVAIGAKSAPEPVPAVDGEHRAHPGWEDGPLADWS